MTRSLRPSTIVPMGLVVQDVHAEGGATVITAQSAAAGAACPACSAPARRVHSRYVRTLTDLPLCGRPVQLRLMVRRLRCETSTCPRRIFTERLEPAAPWARRTARLDAVAHQLGLALGGRPGSGFAGRLMMPVSNDTLLRLVRRRGSPAFAPPRAVGIDDWAWKRNFRYGTLICDLERRRTISLLPDREPATAQAWLAAQPQVEVVTRDRGGAGVTIKEIVRRTGHSRGLVRRVLRGQRGDMFMPRDSSLERHLPWLDAQWAAGERNAAALWRKLKDLGFRGCRRVVAEWATRRRRADAANLETLKRTPSARTVARLMTTARDDLSRAQTVLVAAIEAAAPALVEARDIVDAFHTMLRQKKAAALDDWLERASASLLASFASGLRKDRAAVHAAIATAWSNAQAEGQITKLKLVKRQMYGRGKLDLLQARVIGFGA